MDLDRPKTPKGSSGEKQKPLPLFLHIHGGGVGSRGIAPSARRRYCMRWQGVDSSSLPSPYRLWSPFVPHPDTFILVLHIRSHLASDSHAAGLGADPSFESGGR
jgi:hypothetical protein